MSVLAMCCMYVGMHRKKYPNGTLEAQLTTLNLDFSNVYNSRVCQESMLTLFKAHYSKLNYGLTHSLVAR